MKTKNTSRRECFMVSLAALTAACAVQSALAVDEHPVLTATWTGGVSEFDTFPWKDADGNTVPWVNDGTVSAVLKGVYNSNFALKPSFSVYSLKLDYPAKPMAWHDSTGKFCIGAGGLEFSQGATLSGGGTGDRVRLEADQTWRVLSDTRSSFCVGTDLYVWNTSLQTKSRVVAAAGVSQWTLTGSLDLWLTWTNDLSSVDVRFENGATLLLENRFYRASSSGLTDWWACGPALCAKSVAFCGEGTRYWAGGVPPRSSMGVGASNIRLEPLLSPTTLGSVLALEDGADVACDGAVLTIPAISVDGGDSVFSGSLTLDEDALSVTIGADSSLAFENMTLGAGRNPTITLSGAGTFVRPSCIRTPIVTTDAAQTVVVKTSGRLDSVLSGPAKLEVDPGTGKYLYLPSAAFAGFTGTSVVVKSGTLVLDEALPGVTVSEAGGTCIYGSGLIVTDRERTETTLTVSQGQQLLVFGSGLTSKTSLVFEGAGTNLVFLGTATIAAPISYTAADKSFIESSDESIVGTISGAVSVSDGGGLCATGPGWVVFAGGAAFAGSAEFLVLDRCHVKFTQGDYTFERGGCGISYFENYSSAAGYSDQSFGRYLGIMDGGRFSSTCTMNTYTRTGMVFRPTALCAMTATDSSGYGTKLDGEAVIEIGPGGSVDIHGTATNSSFLRIGQGQSRAYLKITGGELKLNQYCRFYLGSGGVSTGILEMDSGILEIPCGFTDNGSLNSMNHSIITWRGGTIRTGSAVSSRLMFNQDSTGTGMMRMDLQVAGDGCVLDLTDYPYGSYTNRALVNTRDPAYEIQRGEWWGHGTLTVKGGKEFVMNAFPDGVKLRLEGANTRVVVPEGAKVFDYEQCAQYCGWRDPWATRDDTRSEELIDRRIGLAELAVAGEDVSFENVHADRTLTIGNLVVATGGVFDTASTIVSDTRTITDATFADQSVFRLGGTDGVPARLSVEEDLTLPERLGYTVAVSGSALGGDYAVMTAGDALVGWPVWTAVGRGRGWNQRISSDGKSVEFVPSGFVLMVR